MADSSESMQSLLDIGADNSKMEKFILQPVKSVILEIFFGLRRSAPHQSKEWDLDGARMLTVDKTMHVGICRSADSDESAVTENIKKPGGLRTALCQLGFMEKMVLTQKRLYTCTKLMSCQFFCTEWK